MASLSPPSSHHSSPTASPDGSGCSSPKAVLSEEHTCQICEEKYRQPCVLSCLHTFCLECLEKQLSNKDDEDLEDIKTGMISCAICKQETKVPEKGVADLPTDLVLCNMLDMSDIEDMQIVCTSCKAKEKAVARCSDCANYLCPNCVTAHQYMRCFENHKVVSFDDLQNGEGLSLEKPMFCKIHTSENMKYFCESCQIPACHECLGEHKQHVCERVSDTDTRQREELTDMVTESKTKIDVCDEIVAGLNNSLADLQMQRDNAKGLIEETFQSYKAVLEKRQEELLTELEEMHSAHELAIMEMSHNVEKTVERIEDGCKFTERVLKNGSNMEVLAMKKIISSQLLSLVNNTPKLEVNVKLEFQSDEKKFKEAIRETFGSFKKDDESKEKDENQTLSLHSSFENEAFALPAGVLGSDAAPVLPPVTAPEFIPNIPTLPPLSIPHIASLAASVSGVSAQTINSIASSMQNLPTERSSSRNSYSPAMSDSGISVDAASTGSGSNAPVVNLAALAKLGTVNVNGQGQITLNGQVIPGLNVNNVTGLPQALASTRVQTPTQTQPDPNLASLLGGGNTASSSGSSRSQTPQLSDITGLLNQPASQLNGLGSIGSVGSGSIGNLSSHSGSGTPVFGGLNLTTPPPPLTPTFSATSSNFTSVGSNFSSNSVNFNPNTMPPFPARGSGKTNAIQIRCKFGQLGPGKGQFNSPHGFCLGVEEDIIVADTNNHRVQVFEKTGEFKYQFGIPGRDEGQLWYPRKVAVMRHSGKYVVCDRGNERSRMQIFNKNGNFLKKIAIRYIDIVAGLAITQQGHIVAVDSVSPTVFCIAETGDLIKWFDCSDYMREPSDIAISGKEYFVCDFKGHCVVVFNEEGQFVRRIGCENITNFPNGIDISDAGDVLVGDSHGNRFHVAVFQRDGSLIGEFECPYVKVSRCCGLKITSEGYVVTLAKNNHHVLVLNTLYIT